QRVKLVARHALGQARTLSEAYPGIMHAIMFWGFLALFMGTVLATIDYDITLPFWGYKLLKGRFYLFYETVLDLFGLFFVIGLGMAVWRRFVLRPPRVDPTARFAGVLALLFVINVSGFVLEACPAYVAGTALSTKQIIVKLKRHMHGQAPGPIHGELIKPEELWACTTCMACVEECPAFIDIVDTIIDLRRYLTLSEGALPST